MRGIPANIKVEHILQAVKEIDINGFPKRRKSTKFDVKIDGSIYPPKYLISLANKYANGYELDSTYFSGGDEANDFLSKLGFNIIPKDDVSITYPFESHSWRLISPSVFIKKMDKSSFLHKGTGIPSDIREFFGIENMQFGDKKNIYLVHRDIKYGAFFTLDKQPVPRARLFWNSSFTKLLEHEMPEWFSYFKENDFAEEPPLLRLQQIEEYRYKVEIINPKAIVLDVEYEAEHEPVPEGAAKYYYSKVYERKPENRKRAIEIHGLQCSVCRFDFERHYGTRGTGFIEIHHNKPLYINGEEVVINPETDLSPVCSNCHRMIHRSRDEILSVEELRNLYKR